MRVLVASNHRYPARNYPATAGGIASSRVTDCLVKGLAELGHDVFFQLDNGAARAVPAGVTLVSGTAPEVDIQHLQTIGLAEIDEPDKPWVKTIHVDLRARGRHHVVRDNWIFVSRTLAHCYGKKRYVLNGIDPSEFIYSETKHDYLLFMCTLDRATEKGLDVVLSLSDRTGCKIVIAGSSADPGVVEKVRERCRNKSIKLVGEVQGQNKAELLAGAKAVLFPTQFNEAFGLVMAEALVSGTPVICSNRGACPEIISPETGFVCQTENDYLDAISSVHKISSADCRARALNDYHYLKMAGAYVEQYEMELSRDHDSRSGTQMTLQATESKSLMDEVH